MSEITKTIDRKLKAQGGIVRIFFAGLIVFVYFFGLGIPLLGPDESRYAQVAREMFERGDWITPTLGGFHWFEKPALLYWLQIASYKLFGVSEFAARFGSALFGLGMVASLWMLGRNYPQINTDGHRSKPDFANWLALIAASSIGIIVFSRGASFDIILTFPMTAALVSFFLFDRASVRWPAVPLISFYFFIGVSLLAKGLIGIVFPFAIVGFYFLLSWRLPSKKFIYSLFWGTALAAAVASLWYLPMYLRHGYAFIDEFFIQHHFQRYTSNKYFHPQPFYFFFWVLPLMTIPWLPFFFAAVWDITRKIFYRKDSNTEDVAHRKNPVATPPGSDKPLLHFSLAWLAVPLIFFSFSGSKLPGYILPALPPAIVITAIYIWRFVQQSDLRRRIVQAIAGVNFVIILILLQFVVPGFADADSVKGLIEAANTRGYSSARVVNFYTLSHNAEFYAAGRLLRDEQGKQRRLLTAAEILDQIENDGRPVLVLMPTQPQFLQALRNDPRLSTEVLADNGELLITLASKNY